MTPNRTPRLKLPLLPSLPKLPQVPVESITGPAKPLLDGMVGTGKRRELLENALAHLPLVTRPAADFSGWTAGEFLTFGKLPPVSPRPHRRAGQDTVELINRLSGVLPLQVVPLARAITDAAPPVDVRVNPALGDVLDKYLPESLRAYHTTGPADLRAKAEQLLLAQLGLLHDVTSRLLRAEVDHNDRDLKIQEAFLRERFADLTPSTLNIPPHAEGAEGAAGTGRRTPPPAPSRPHTSIPSRGRIHVRMDNEPLVLFPGHGSGDWRLLLRLALPKGHPATLGFVFETFNGATGFDHARRRWYTGRQRTGFRSPQVDVNLKINVTGVKRFIVYATSSVHGQPTRTVLFVRDGNRTQADMSTLLADADGASTTVVCSGYATTEGLLLRNESLLYPNLRAACTGFGYERVDWLDEDTPIV